MLQTHSLKVYTYSYVVVALIPLPLHKITCMPYCIPSFPAQCIDTTSTHKIACLIEHTYVHYDVCRILTQFLGCIHVIDMLHSDRSLGYQGTNANIRSTGLQSEIAVESSSGTSANLIPLILVRAFEFPSGLSPAASRIFRRSRLPKMDKREGVPEVVKMRSSVGLNFTTARNRAARQKRISLFLR